MKLHYSITTFFCSATLAFFTGCGSSVSKPAPPPVNITVAISPKTANLGAGEQQTFVATVTGTDNKGVTWSLREPASGATLTQNGVYTAPMMDGTYQVAATSVVDTTKSDVATIQVTSQRALEYTDPAPGNYFRFVKNTALSTPERLVLNLVATGQAGQCAGIAFTLSLNNANAANWAKVEPADTMPVQNGAVFNLGSAPTGLKATHEAARLKAVIAQKGVGNLVDLNSGVLARVALELNAGAAKGTVALNVDKFQVISGNRSITTIATGNVRFGTLAVN